MVKSFEKIKKEEDFKKVRQAGRFWSGKLVRITVLKKEDSGVRVGIVVSKRVSKLAVVRNKVRRRINAILQKSFTETRDLRADIIITAMGGIENATFEQLAEEINAGLKKLLIK